MLDAAAAGVRRARFATVEIAWCGLMSPKLTTIVPCYQAAATLEATLRSVAKQHSREWECIIVNDGSTDDSPQIAERFAAHDSRFRILHQANGGLAAARNSGIKAARGE